jgi:hypothetical protein
MEKSSRATLLRVLSKDSVEDSESQTHRPIHRIQVVGNQRCVVRAAQKLNTLCSILKKICQHIFALVSRASPATLIAYEATSTARLEFNATRIHDVVRQRLRTLNTIRIKQTHKGLVRISFSSQAAMHVLAAVEMFL